MENKSNKLTKVFSIIIAVVLVIMLSIMTYSGYVYWMGPFKGLALFKIRQTYSVERTDEIIFYGASNFARWWNMEDDMAEYGYTVQNHAFGGSCDKDLIDNAAYLVYPYKPRAIFIQTGSNDYIEGVDFADVIKNKETLYKMLSENCPNAVIIIMGGLPLPGRAQYQTNIDKVNEFCEEYCLSHDRFYYVDSNSAILGNDGKPIAEYFESDGIHLNNMGHAAWTPCMTAALVAANISTDK